MTKDYTSNSASQTAASRYAITLLKQSIIEMAESNPERFKDISAPFGIADLGCSTGINSIETMKTCIETIRTISPEMPICLYLEDTAANDFNETLAVVQKGLEEYDDIHIYCIGRSFYQPLFPTGSVDLIYTLSAIHWTRKVGGPHKNHFYLSENSSKNDEVGKKWREIAEEDWATFLKLREKELRKGGRLLVSSLVCSEEMSEHDKKFAKIFSYFNSTLESLLEKYKLKDHVEDFTLPAVLRNKSDLCCKLDDGTTKTLKLKHYEEILVERPLSKLKADDEESRKVFAERQAKAILAYTGGLIKTGLNKHLPDPSQTEKIYGELYEGFIVNFQNGIKDAVECEYQPRFYLIAGNDL
jgi:hypothetical protein